MTRETDIEIARLAGSPEAPPYSEDLGAIMELVRHRWPDAVVRLSPFAAFLWNDWLAANVGSFAADPLGEGVGATDAERLANAVLAALRMEARP